ncbi:MAG: PAS domain S-box protein [Desulfobacterales bacterium]|nr:PAS domain S-box protein [Desulfobacterales bacterium]
MAMGLVAWQRRKNVYYETLFRAEARLLESEQKFRQLFENMTTGFALHEMIYDPNGQPVDYRFIEINPAFEKLTGLQAQNLIGRTVKEVLPKTEPYWIETFGKVAQSGEPVSFENYAQEIGRYFDVRAFSPAPPMFATVFSDITERKRAEETLRLSHLKKIESLERMAGGIAHHYNNLMTIVMGNLEIAIADLPGQSGPTEALTSAMNAASRAAELAGMMLTYLGMTVGWRQPLDLSEACRGLLPGLLADLPKHVTMETDLPEPGPVVKADAGQIRQMLHALVVNAWEAMHSRPGIVSLNVRRASPADIATTHRRPVEFQPNAPGYACLEVKDTGCGIAQSDFEKLFDPFYSTKFTGRGLGLSVALGAVKAHNGCITLESELGRGSIFKIFLPLDTEAAAPPQNNRRTDDV